MDVVIVKEPPDAELSGEIAVESAGSAEGRFSHLPEPVHLEDTISSADTVVHFGPDLDRNPDTDFLIRYGAL